MRRKVLRAFWRSPRMRPVIAPASWTAICAGDFCFFGADLVEVFVAVFVFVFRFAMGKSFLILGCPRDARRGG